MDTQTKPDNRKPLSWLIAATVGMFGFAFALVPLYDVFCEITGINGKTDDVAAAQSSQVDTSRLVTVEFVSYINPGLGWEFEPEVKSLQVHPGQTRTINYRAVNLSGAGGTGQAVPSVTPGLAAQYLNKIECFCFNSQPLDAGQKAELPLIFYVDPEIPDDIERMTLAYTLFNVAGKAE